MYFVRTAKELQKRGHEVDLICLPDSSVSQFAASDGINILPVLRKGPGRVSSIFRLSKLLDSGNYDVIHTHLSNDLWTIVPALKLSRSKSKLVLTKCMASGVSKKDFLHRYLYRRIDKITAVSRFISKNVVETCPVPIEKIVILHDSVSSNEFNPEAFSKNLVRKELGFLQNDIVVGIIGRISPGKGFEIFFESVRRLSSLPENDKVRFLAVGSSSPGEREYEIRLMKLANELGVKEKIRFAGFQSDIPKFLSVMDLLAFPSNEESFGGTALEAMAMELPVAAFDSAGVPDIVINGETGILAKRNDIAGFTEALSILIHEPLLRKKLGSAGRKRVLEHFDINLNMNTVLELYKELLS